MSAYEALQTATLNAAKILKNEDAFGTVACGKTADLLLVQNNPLDDLNNLSKVQAVFLNGEQVSEKWMCNLQ
jgi:imidazolonepropionase-like amidohydrolase